MTVHESHLAHQQPVLWAKAPGITSSQLIAMNGRRRCSEETQYTCRLPPAVRASCQAAWPSAGCPRTLHHAKVRGIARLAAQVSRHALIRGARAPSHSDRPRLGLGARVQQHRAPCGLRGPDPRNRCPVPFRGSYRLSAPTVRLRRRDLDQAQRRLTIRRPHRDGDRHRHQGGEAIGPGEPLETPVKTRDELP